MVGRFVIIKIIITITIITIINIIIIITTSFIIVIIVTNSLMYLQWIPRHSCHDNLADRK